MALLTLALIACAPTGSRDPSSPEPPEEGAGIWLPPEPGRLLPGRADEADPEQIGSPVVTEQSAGTWQDPVFSDTEVMQIEVILSDASYAALKSSPTTFVEGALRVGDHTWSPVGVRLKGSASYQPIDAKANFKIKLEGYTDERFYGLDRLTLQNNIWDPSMMAQDLAYRFFAAAGVPSPRTGYAWVQVNGADKGLYTILESMDSQFVDREFPDSEGNLYEMTRSCDFTGDGSCFELQVEGDGEPDPEHALDSAVAAVHLGDTESLREAFDWDRLIRFLATERVINHPDSYSYNLNNFFLYHDPVEDRVSMIPWGADSTFVYSYPPTVTDYACEASAYLDVLSATPAGWLGRHCQSDDACWTDLSAAMHEVAALLISSDLAGYAERNRERIRPYVEDDPLVTYGPEHFEARVDCFVTWIGERPDEIEAWLAR